MRRNNIKEKLMSGGVCTVVSGSVMTGDMIELFGQFGFDGAWIECEHGPITWNQLGDLARACDLCGMTSVTRVPAKDPWIITRTLDRGVNGIVVPHVNTREDAELVVRASKFGPIGDRGIYGGRRSFGRDDFFQKANEETLLVVLIEEITAVENLSEILQVEHIDVFFVASGDLAQTMGLVGQHTHPEVVAVAEGVIRQIADAGRVAGTNIMTHSVDRALEQGARFLMAQADGWLASGAKSFLSEVDSCSKSVVKSS